MLTHHSDRGVLYASNEFQALLKANDVRCSMSRKGNCWDNAVAESFFHNPNFDYSIRDFLSAGTWIYFIFMATDCSKFL